MILRVKFLIHNSISNGTTRPYNNISSDLVWPPVIAYILDFIPNFSNKQLFSVKNFFINNRYIQYSNNLYDVSMQQKLHWTCQLQVYIQWCK